MWRCKFFVFYGWGWGGVWFAKFLSVGGVGVGCKNFVWEGIWRGAVGKNAFFAGNDPFSPHYVPPLNIIVRKSAKKVHKISQGKCEKK